MKNFSSKSYTKTRGNHINRLTHLTIAAIGVVFGDIGTSPLYAVKAVFNPEHGIDINKVAIMGITSLLFWALSMVVTLKYMYFVVRADNNGEGGILALTVLALRKISKNNHLKSILMMMGIFGACMFYGDAVITPAISVLSAVEGLELIAPSLKASVIPFTLIILVLLFFIQSHGTEQVGRIFGPFMVFWFLLLGVLGIFKICQFPEILLAINPIYSIQFIKLYPIQAYIVLSAIVLVLTGAEALYADIGHFGTQPIRFGWYGFVMPALMLNYFGQGALLLSNPLAIDNPFYRLAPEWALLPLVLIATAATIIAAQAVISGAFSLTSQAIHLGYIPRMKILHTSQNYGQIYIPFVNWLILLIIIGIVLFFKNSSHLSVAYGLAVTATMLITTLLLSVVMHRVWGWPKFYVSLITIIFLGIDFAFLSANLAKVLQGGWLPLGLGIVLYFLLTTWYKGRKLIIERTAKDGVLLEPFVEQLISYPLEKVSGTGIYLSGNPHLVPTSLLHNLKHNKIMHERTILLTVNRVDIPYVNKKESTQFTQLNNDLYLVKATFGFKERADMTKVLNILRTKHHLHINLMETSFFLARESIVLGTSKKMSNWRKKIFILMHQNASKPSDFFAIPSNRVVELGTKIEL